MVEKNECEIIKMETGKRIPIPMPGDLKGAPWRLELKEKTCGDTQRIHGPIRIL